MIKIVTLHKCLPWHKMQNLKWALQLQTLLKPCQLIFNDAERQATKDASKTARLNFKRITNDPTKKKLSTMMETTIRLPSFTAENTGPKILEKKLQRSLFNCLTKDLVRGK